MNARWPAMQHPKGSKLDNEKSHGHRDPNGGGGPASPVNRNFKPIPTAMRGGMGHQGRDRMASHLPAGHPKSTHPNPAGRGSMPSVGRQSFPSETRNPGHGGAVQERSNISAPRGGGFGKSGQVDVPGVRSNPTPGAGNTSGKMFRRISHHFNNRSKGPRNTDTGTKGSYGDRAPVTANT